MVVLDTGVVVVNPTTGAGQEETKEWRQDECLRQVILPGIPCRQTLGVGRARRVIIWRSCGYTRDVADHQYSMEIYVCEYWFWQN